MQEPKMVIAVRKDLQMRKGKLAAQVAHASMQFILDADDAENGLQFHVDLSNDEAAWLHGLHKKIVVGVDSEEELQQLVFRAKMSDLQVYTVTDVGLTEFNGIETVTCAAFGPASSEDVDYVTGHLKLL